VTASKEFILSGEGCQDNKNTDCKWELYGPPLLNGQISKRSVESSRLISVSYAKEFHLDPSNLIPNRTYTIFFNNNRSGFWAQYSVTTDMPPTGGSCVVSPSEGVVIETQFQISCTEWTDEDSPLWYEFFLSHPVHGSMLLFYGWMPDSVGLFLPAGSKDNDFNVDLFVKITDVLGSYRIVPLQAKVRFVLCNTPLRYPQSYLNNMKEVSISVLLSLFKPVNASIVCDHSKESYWAVLSLCGIVFILYNVVPTFKFWIIQYNKLYLNAVRVKALASLWGRAGNKNIEFIEFGFKSIEIKLI